ncbi:hypothetical protein SCUP515_07700 [Seiridium cupressi]
MQNPGGHSALFGSNRRKRSPRHLRWGREGVRALQRTSRSFECWRAKPDSSPNSDGGRLWSCEERTECPGFARPVLPSMTTWSATANNRPGWSSAQSNLVSISRRQRLSIATPQTMFATVCSYAGAVFLRSRYRVLPPPPPSAVEKAQN